MPWQIRKPDEISEDVTYYVDGDNGNDENDGLSLAAAKKTMDFLYSGGVGAIPRKINNNAVVTIDVRGTVLSPGTVYHTRITNFWGTGSIVINGNTTDVDTGIAITGQDNTSSSITYHSYLDASGEAWTANEHRGRYIVITGGTGNGSTLYPIMSNTATRLESYSLPDTDGTTVIKIVSVPQLKGAQVSDPGTLVNYTAAAPYELRNLEVPIRINNLDLTNVTTSDTWQIKLTTENVIVYNVSMDLAPLLQWTGKTEWNRCFIRLDNWRFFWIANHASASLYDSVVYSSDGSGLGFYNASHTHFILNNMRLHNQSIGYSSDAGATAEFQLRFLIDEGTTGIAPNGTSVNIFPYNTGAYGNFKNLVTAIQLGGGKFLCGNSITLQGTGVTTEIKVSDTSGDTALLSDLNNQITVQNTATGAVVDYVNSATFVPIQNPEYDNATSGLVSNNFQGAIDELVNYAAITFEDNATATSITLVDSYFLVTDFDTNMPAQQSTADQVNNKLTLGATGDYRIWFTAVGESAAALKTFEWDVFELEATTALEDATQADPVVITATGHGLSNGDRVAIKGAGGMVEINDRIFTVQDVSGATFELCDDGGASPANDIDGTGFTAYTSGGTIQKANKTNIHSHRKFNVGGSADIGSFGDEGIYAATKDRTLELYIKGNTDTTNFTHEHCTMGLHRVG